jgi:hypothetical protein
MEHARMHSQGEWALFGLWVSGRVLHETHWRVMGVWFSGSLTTGLRQSKRRRRRVPSRLSAASQTQSPTTMPRNADAKRGEAPESEGKLLVATSTARKTSEAIKPFTRFRAKTWPRHLSSHTWKYRWEEARVSPTGSRTMSKLRHDNHTCVGCFRVSVCWWCIPAFPPPLQPEIRGLRPDPSLPCLPLRRRQPSGGRCLDDLRRGVSSGVRGQLRVVPAGAGVSRWENEDV